MANQNKLRYVTYCGLYCNLCAQRNRIPQQARQLQKSLHEEGFDDFYQYIPEMKEERAKRGMVYVDIRCPRHPKLL